MKADFMRQDAEAGSIPHSQQLPQLHHALRGSMAQTLQPTPSSPSCVKLVPQDFNLDCSEWFGGDSSAAVADIWKDDPDMLTLDTGDWLLSEMGK
jgi:hypothetical protein